jgi:hypothetical protein
LSSADIRHSRKVSVPRIDPTVRPISARRRDRGSTVALAHCRLESVAAHLFGGDSAADARTDRNVSRPSCPRGSDSSHVGRLRLETVIVASGRVKAEYCVSVAAESWTFATLLDAFDQHGDGPAFMRSKETGRRSFASRAWWSASMNSRVIYVFAALVWVRPWRCLRPTASDGLSPGLSVNTADISGRALGDPRVPEGYTCRGSGWQRSLRRRALLASWPLSGRQTSSPLL